MKLFLFLTLLLSGPKLKAQHIFDSGVIEGLGPSQFYFVGQAHGNRANTLIEQDFLFGLNRTYGVRYDVLEYAHSAAFLVNQYLATGADSLLAFINPEAHFTFIRAVKAYNDRLPPEKRITFYGVDFEGRHDGLYTQKAIEIIVQQSSLPAGQPLANLLSAVISSPSALLKANLLKLNKHLEEKEQESRQLLGGYFIDASLIAGAPYGFAANRDQAMMANFKRLHRELTLQGEHPKFFASFGIGHINPENPKGIALRLLQDEESPVRGRVSIVGIQYLNCQFCKQGISKPTDGNLNFLCNRAISRKLALQTNEQEAISYLSTNELERLGCGKNIKKFSGLIVVRNFGATKFWTWD